MTDSPGRKGEEQDRILADHLSQSLTVTETLLKSLLDEIRGNADKDARIRQLTEDMVAVKRTLYGENGQQPNGLTTRLRLVEDHLNEHREEDRESRKDDRTGRWQIYAALILGGLSFLASVISLLQPLISKILK